MKNIFKLLTLMLVLISALGFSQTDCIKDLPIKIGTPIRTDQFDWNPARDMNEERMISYLVAFNNSFERHVSGEKVPSSYVETLNAIDSKYYTLTNELVSKSSDFTSFRENILNKLLIIRLIT